MNAGDWAQIVVTLLLVGLTGWYAWQTQNMVKNMEKDREEMHRPILTFQLISWEANLLKLRIQNVGAGAAMQIRGNIESKNKQGSEAFSWSYPLLSANQFEEFGFPVANGTKNEERFQFDKIKDRVIEVKAEFKYKSTAGKEYELIETIPIKEVTEDWINSRMLVTNDHPERIMPRIAKTLENIEGKLSKR